ncbi:hypothetical protein COJ67_03140 [Bacillus thuringiensis]|uniref:HEPN domain-containing protein n=1 Tax=Bacillus thuringiensis TaxID=1428 RepID=UPI000BF83E74|nr:HEPN domain-containing protein [Bacillus thuringiensis]PFN92111.1 hypothetical protein COJ67_03140 [Bacillus thuringiensis]PGY05572.1 hypothetical protein COE41_02920 [Bacillus thuringiensis]
MNRNRLKQAILETVKCLKEQGIDCLYMTGAHIQVHGCRIHKSLMEIDKFSACLNFFLKEPVLNKNLSRTTIVTQFLSILKNALGSENPNQLVLELLNQLESKINDEKEFKVYVPLKGIDLSENEPFVINTALRIVPAQITPENVQKEFLSFLGSDEDACSFIEQSIITPDFLKAMEIAVESSKILVHFLRFIDYHIWDEESLSLRLPGYGALMEELRVMAVPASEETFSAYNWKLKEARDEILEVDSEFVEDSKEVGIERFGEIINKFVGGNLTDMENQVFRSIIWFGESKIEHDNAARFLKLTLVLECLLNTSKNEPVTATLSDRVALLLESNVEDRLRMVEKIGELYNVRSEIVHTGSSNIEEMALFELESIVSRLISLFLIDPEYSCLENKKGLKNKIDKMKFSS